MPHPGLRLKEPAIAGYAYNPPQTPPFEKEGLVVSLWLTSPSVSTILSVTTSFCTISTALYAKIKRSKISAICKKKGVKQILRLLGGGGYLLFCVSGGVLLMCVELYCSV